MGITIPSIYIWFLMSQSFTWEIFRQYKVFTWELFRQYMVCNVTKCSHGNYSVNIWFLMLQSVYMGIIPSIYGF